jgi:hypothetical protein
MARFWVYSSFRFEFKSILYGVRSRYRYRYRYGVVARNTRNKATSPLHKVTRYLGPLGLLVHYCRVWGPDSFLMDGLDKVPTS